MNPVTIINSFCTVYTYKERLRSSISSSGQVFISIDMLQLFFGGGEGLKRQIKQGQNKEDFSAMGT